MGLFWHYDRHHGMFVFFPILPWVGINDFLTLGVFATPTFFNSSHDGRSEYISIVGFNSAVDHIRQMEKMVHGIFSQKAIGHRPL